MAAASVTLFLSAVGCGGSSNEVAKSSDAVSAAESTLRHERVVIDLPAEVLDFPAGTFCDFHAFGTSQDVQKGSRFYDAEGNLVKVIWQVTETNVFKNVDTGYTLYETIHYTVHRDVLTGEMTISGQNFQTRDASGKLVIHAAGRMLHVYDPATDSFVMVFSTPGVVTDLAQAICTALGGAPAM